MAIDGVLCAWQGHAVAWRKRVAACCPRGCLDTCAPPGGVPRAPTQRPLGCTSGSAARRPAGGWWSGYTPTTQRPPTNVGGSRLGPSWIIACCRPLLHTFLCCYLVVEGVRCRDSGVWSEARS